MSRLKFAELTSGIGVLVLGMGLGALFAQWLSPSAGLILFVGVITHALGMWDKHRLETQANVETGPWVAALYWVCWLLLGGVLIALLAMR
jgi:hypothetical protein